MRQYIYVSRRKVDLLYAQIPTRIRDLANRLKLTVGPVEFDGLGGSLDTTTLKKLVRVEAYLKKRDLITDLDALADSQIPTQVPYVRGTLPVTYCVFQKGDFPFNESWGGMSLLYFGGESNKLLLGLGAAPDGLMNRGEPAPIGHITASDPGFLLRTLARFESTQPRKQEGNDFRELARDQHVSSIVGSMMDLAIELHGHPVHADFVAQVILIDRHPPVTAVLGTPLFVSQAFPYSMGT